MTQENAISNPNDHLIGGSFPNENPLIDEPKVVETDENNDNELDDEADAGDESDSGDENDELENKVDEQPVLKIKKKKTAEQRIKEIGDKTFVLREQERKNEAIALRAEQALARLEQMNAINENPRPIADSFETHDDYVEAITRWTMKQAKFDEKQAQIQQEQANYQTPYQQTVLRDFQHKREKAIEKNSNYLQNENRVKNVLNHYQNVTVSDMILESKVSTEVIEYFGKNIEELERISRMSIGSASKEFWNIENKITAKPKERLSKAPKPASIVTGKGGGTVTNYANMTPKQFMDARNKELKR